MTKFKIFRSKLRRQWVFSVVTALGLALAFSSLALAEITVDPPRVQTVGNYRVNFVEPVPGANHDAPDNLTLRFLVTDLQGQPASNLQLNLTAIRDYSGQVTKEHNGPRTPNIGPMPLKAGTAPGEYTANLTFGINGHWFVQVDGPGFGASKVQFRLPVGAADEPGVGFDYDWLLWLAVAVVVLGIVAVIGRRGEVFPVPADELEPPRPTAALTAPPRETNSDDLAVSGSNKE